MPRRSNSESARAGCETQPEMPERIGRFLFNRQPMIRMASFDLIGCGPFLVRFRDGPCESERMRSKRPASPLEPGSAEYSTLSCSQLNRFLSLGVGYGRRGTLRRERYLRGTVSS